MHQERYAGDKTAREVWSALADDPSAQLVDVRTAAEWTFVGLPDLRMLGKVPLLIEWQSYPSMQRNEAFIPLLGKEMESLALLADTPLFFLCRSGARSMAAAMAATAAGFTAAYNVVGGFEGPLSIKGQRGDGEGWKACGLPWTQS